MAAAGACEGRAHPVLRTPDARQLPDLSTAPAAGAMPTGFLAEDELVRGGGEAYPASAPILPGRRENLADDKTGSCSPVRPTRRDAGLPGGGGGRARGGESAKARQAETPHKVVLRERRTVKLWPWEEAALRELRARPSVVTWWVSISSPGPRLADVPTGFRTLPTGSSDAASEAGRDAFSQTRAEAGRWVAAPSARGCDSDTTASRKEVQGMPSVVTWWPANPPSLEQGTAAAVSTMETEVGAHAAESRAGGGLLSLQRPESGAVGGAMPSVVTWWSGDAAAGAAAHVAARCLGRAPQTDACLALSSAASLCDAAAADFRGGAPATEDSEPGDPQDSRRQVGAQVGARAPVCGSDLVRASLPAKADHPTQRLPSVLSWWLATTPPVSACLVAAARREGSRSRSSSSSSLAARCPCAAQHLPSVVTWWHGEASARRRQAQRPGPWDAAAAGGSGREAAGEGGARVLDLSPTSGEGVENDGGGERGGECGESGQGDWGGAGPEEGVALDCTTEAAPPRAPSPGRKKTPVAPPRRPPSLRIGQQVHRSPRPRPSPLPPPPYPPSLSDTQTIDI